MASNHINVRNGLRGSGGEHFHYLIREGHYAYIAREGKFEERADLQVSGSGNMPVWAAHDPSLFWKAADQYERTNGRMYKEVVVSLPRALGTEQRVDLVNEFIGHLVGERHAYTWAIHNPSASDGGEQPHAHIMFSTRTHDGIERDPAEFFKRWNREHPEKGGAGKDPYFDTRRFIRDVREEWAMTANHFMSRHGIEARIEHRSYKTLGIDLEPSVKVGPAHHAGERGVMENVLAENRARARRNGDRLLINPSIGVHALTTMQSTFSRRDVEQFVFRNTDDEEQFRQVYARMMNSKELLALKDASREGEWFTSSELRDIEVRLVGRARVMASTDLPGATDVGQRERVRESRDFNGGQDAAFLAATSSGQLVVVNGAAGTGKSYVLAAAREALDADGYRVIGAALQGKTADDMQRDAGITSRTLHSLLSGIERGSVTLDNKTVLVVDEAGMVGSRQMEKLLGHAQGAESRVRLVGDAFQLHAVDAGDAFRAVSREAMKAGKLESLTEIMRQKEAWQRDASLALSRHDIETAVVAYAERGNVEMYPTISDARERLVTLSMADHNLAPQETQILLTHTNEQRQALNVRVRELRKGAGELGRDHLVQAGDRNITLAEGDRLMFLQNEYVMQVKNGTLATVERIESKSDERGVVKEDGVIVHVRLDDGKRVAVDTAQYGHFDHGYALTIHKSQGVTVDRAYVLATQSMHSELAYVAMTRHKNALLIAASMTDFADGDAMVRSLTRADEKAFSATHELRPASERSKEMGYRHTLGQRRVEMSSAPRQQRAEKSLIDAVAEYADGLAAATIAKQAGKPVTAKDRAALKRGRVEVNKVEPAMRRDIRHVVEHDDRAWRALVELSGAARAAALVAEVRRVRAEQEEAARPTPSRRVPAKRFADMSVEEREQRRREFRNELHKAVRKPTERTTRATERAKTRGRGGQGIGD
ncbi:AAA family ATPase [Caballeronia sordidicola]|uniref:Conjugal transfer protein TraA n=1 Tax=Caballeronia sordidicola TaxID=196367 RepID=A0A242N491_CABSO|nr:AAA family ATPase [Caballeronia sordidicola]OTP78479.1 Conjugal transfer protein TraA [Caballeronia sordidicola]